MHFLNLAQGALIVNFLPQAQTFAPVAVVAHLGDHIHLLRHVPHLAGFLNGMGQRFFDISMLAQLHG